MNASGKQSKFGSLHLFLFKAYTTSFLRPERITLDAKLQQSVKMTRDLWNEVMDQNDYDGNPNWNFVCMLAM